MIKYSLNDHISIFYYKW